ncbi:MAG: hypothetical protein FWC52_03890, partial [Candidatus Methanoplasma sp.]|nr:hypothetical protein [Candidatus Methanoplasma sp.]
MPSTVIVKMNTCGKTHKITVSLRDDGDLDVKIVSDCKHVQEYAELLTKVGMSDITDRHGSKILDPDICTSLSFPCLVPSGVLD